MNRLTYISSNTENISELIAEINKRYDDIIGLLGGDISELETQNSFITTDKYHPRYGKININCKGKSYRLGYSPIALVPNNTIFVDSSDNVLKFKTYNGVILELGGSGGSSGADAGIDDIIRFYFAGLVSTQKILEVTSAFTYTSGYLIPDKSNYTTEITGGVLYATLATHQLYASQPNFRGIINIAQYSTYNANQYTFSNLGGVPTGGEGGAVQTVGISLYSADILTQLSGSWTSPTTKYYLEMPFSPSSPLGTINTDNGRLILTEFSPEFWTLRDIYMFLFLDIIKV